MKATTALAVRLSAVGLVLIAGLNVAATAPIKSNISTSTSESPTRLSADHFACSADMVVSFQRKPDSLCDASERVLFSALVKGSNKVVSICSSRKIDKQQGYLQYRFGRPGQVELEFPSSRQDTQKSFAYTRYTRPLVTYLTVKFTSNGYSYSIHHDFNDEIKPAENEAYLVVAPAGKEDDAAAAKKIHLQRGVKGSLTNLEDLVPNENWYQEHD
jgi:hypothetical protein